jgi:hypothetical protein
MSETPTLSQAVQALASVCDGAIAQDFQGFAGPDVTAGHYFASIPQELWGEAWERKIHTILRKYRRQLEGFGIDYDAIPAPSEGEAASRFSKWDHINENRAKGIDTRKGEKVKARTVNVVNGQFEITVHKMDREGREALKDAVRPRFDWDAKVWRTALKNADRVEEWAADYEATVAPAAQAVFEQAQMDLFEPEVKADVTVTYDEATDSFVIGFEFGPHFKRALDLVRQIEGRQFNGTTKTWSVPAKPESIPGLRRLWEAAKED